MTSVQTQKQALGSDQDSGTRGWCCALQGKMPSGFSHGCLGVHLVPQAVAGQDQQLIPTLQGVLVKLGGADQGSPKDMVPTCNFLCGLQAYTA